MDKRGKHWLRHSICVHPFMKLNEPDKNGYMIATNHMHWHTLKVFDYPATISNKYAWYIQYYFAKMQVRFPRYYLSMRVAGYFPEAEADVETQMKRKISAAKAQITKIQNVMNARRQQLSSQLFQDETTDPIMVKARRKLAEKEFNLQQLLNE